ncbi:MAG: flagella assembly protein FlgT middle domain-containing protein [Granulosicoccus sp.]
MTVSFYKISIVGIVLALLAGCSFIREKPDAGQLIIQQSVKHAIVDKTGTLAACLPEAGTPFHFRKAILVAGTLGVPYLSRDLPGLAELTSKRIQTHLEALDRFNVLANHDSSFDTMASTTAAHVKHLGQKFASQFVVKVEIEDLTMHSTRWWLPKIIRRNNKRNVMISLYIYGTEHGALFHSQRFQTTVSGNIAGYPGNGSMVTTPWFKTTLGNKIDGILKDMSAVINEQLACVPFSSRVTAVEGDNIHINAGFLQGLRPGANLRVYRNRDMLALDGTKKQRESEWWVTVNAVFPSHSIAIATQSHVGGNGLHIGDIVRAW